MGTATPPPTEYDANPSPGRDVPPIGIRDLLRISLGLFRSRWAVMTALSPVALLPAALLGLVAMFVAGVLGAVLGTPIAAQVANEAIKDVLATAALLLTLIAVPYVAGAAALIVCASLLDTECSLSKALFAAVRRPMSSLPTVLMWAGLQFVVLSIPAGLRALETSVPDGNPTKLGTVYLATPLIRLLHLWLAVRLVAFPAVLVVEGASYGRAFRRSWQLTSGRWWRSFGVSTSALVLSAAVCWILMLPMGAMLDIGPGANEMHAMIALVILAVLTFASQGWYMTVLSLLYIDLRARREGLDTTQLRRDLDSAGLPHP